MKVTVYGTDLCSETMKALVELEAANADFEFKNFTKELSVLKEFLHERDSNEMFDQAKKEMRIGIPFFVLEDGSKTHSLNQVLKAIGKK